jgi:DNA-binding transcriptional LysR family regulator
METRLLQYALEVYLKQSFTKAAEGLNIAQPSLSHQIAKLERDLGVSLFFRGPGKVTPTPEGLRFLKKAEHILRLHDDLEREMREQSEGMGSDLAIGTTVITGGHVLPPLLQAFGEQYPNVNIRLVEESTEKLTDLTARGLVDLSILSLPVEDARLATKTMLTEQLFLALPRTEEGWMTQEVRSLVSSQAQNFAASLTLKTLSTAPFILLKNGYGFRRTVLELCAESGFQPQIAYETSSIQTALSLVTYGLGVTLVPEMVARNHHHPRSGALYVMLDSQPTRTMVFAYHKERYLSLASRAFLDLWPRKGYAPQIQH